MIYQKRGTYYFGAAVLIILEDNSNTQLIPASHFWRTSALLAVSIIYYYAYAESTRKILKMHDGYLTEQEVTLISDNKNAKKYKSLLLI